MWLHLLVCTTEMCHLEMCHLGAQVHTLIDRCANNEAVHDPRCSAPPGNRGLLGTLVSADAAAQPATALAALVALVKLSAAGTPSLGSLREDG